MFREGARLRGPGIDEGADSDSMPVADTAEEAMNDRDLDWPEDTPWWVKLRGAFNNRTAMLGLGVALLMPIGDGMESFFRSYQIEVWGWDTQKIASWSWLFVIAGFLGIIGPLISDYIDRRKSMLIWAVLAGASYAAFTVTSVMGLGWQVQLGVWLLVMIFSDWLIFTFLATIVEIADPRMAASSMSVFQSSQAIAATGIFITLGTLLLMVSDSYYPLIWGVAILGPAIGFFLIRQMEYPEQDSGRLDDFSSEIKGKLGGWLDKPLKLDTLEPGRQNQRMAMAVGLVGLVILAGIVGIASVAEVEKEVIGDLESISTVSAANISEDSSTERMGDGDSMSMEIDASNGSILDVVVTVTSSNPSAGLTNPDFTWDLTLSAPQAVMMVGENTSSSTVQADDISATTELDIEVYNKSGFDSQSEAQAWLDDRKGDEDAMYAAGIWNVDLSITGDGDLLQDRQADFTIEVSLSQANATVETSVVENTTITQSEDFGPMLLGVGGLPIIVLTGGVCWLVMREEESD
jgi:MFS family permease